MKLFSKSEVTKIKYYYSAIVVAIVLLGSHYILNYIYGLTSYPIHVDFNLSVSSVIAYFLIGFAISYIHERIPSCASSYAEKIIRYGGMIFLLMLGSLLLFINPTQSEEVHYVIDFAFIFSFAAAIPTVLVLYRFSPGKEIHKGGVCAVK